MEPNALFRANDSNAQRKSPARTLQDGIVRVNLAPLQRALNDVFGRQDLHQPKRSHHKVRRETDEVWNAQGARRAIEDPERERCVLPHRPALRNSARARSRASAFLLIPAHFPAISFHSAIWNRSG